MLFDINDIDNWQIKRLRRLSALGKYLKKVRIIEKRKLMGELGKNGVHRATAETYIKDLQDAGDINEKDGKIIWIGEKKSGQVT